MKQTKLRFGLLVFLLASWLNADTLTLKDGSIIKGRFISGDRTTIRFATANHENHYDAETVESIQFTAQPSGHSPVAAKTQTDRVEIPAGSELIIRLVDSVDSARDHLGQTFRATVDRPVVIGGQTLIPRGSDVIAVLNEAQQSGKMSGRAILTIALRSVVVNGHSYDLDTSSVSKASGSRGAKSGRRIGGGAAVGAIIGGLAGGGKGAAIGAASGGALGTVAQVATSGERVSIPSETVLDFVLRNPVYVSSPR